MQSERAMNALARRNQSAAEHQEKCCFWEALPDADGKAHASREDGEAGVEMKRPTSCKPHSIFLSLFFSSAAPDAETRVRKSKGKKSSNRANGHQPRLREQANEYGTSCSQVIRPLSV